MIVLLRRFSRAMQQAVKDRDDIDQSPLHCPAVHQASLIPGRIDSVVVVLPWLTDL